VAAVNIYLLSARGTWSVADGVLSGCATEIERSIECTHETMEKFILKNHITIALQRKAI
jgi:hypothetical protein